MRIQRTTSIQKDERGLAAIIVTVMLMTVISLIVLSFVQVSRREQVQTLDNQLATQAFYAAESGINLAQSKLALVTTPKTTCGPDSNFTATDYNISADGSVRITCLLINKNVPDIIFQDVNGTSRVSLLKSLSGAPFTNIYVSWQAQSSNTISGCSATDAGRFPTSSGADTWNCNQPLLRLDLVPVAGTVLNATALTANQFTTYLHPINSGTKPTAFNYSDSTGANIGRISATSCTTNITTYKQFCVARIAINTVPSSAYALRLMGVYGSATVSISGSTATETNAVLTEGQVEVDATASAVDIIKRIQTRVSLVPNAGTAADGPLTTTGLGICKQFFVTPDGVDIPAGTDAFCGVN